VAGRVAGRVARRVAGHLGRLTWLLLLSPLVFAAISLMLMLGTEITAPSWIKARIEAQAEAVLDGGSLRFGAITLTLGRDLHPLVRLTDAELRDAEGAMLARVPEMTGTLSPRGLLLRREILLQEISLSGAQIGLRRAADGTVAIAFAGAALPAGQAGSLAELLEQFDAVFERPALAALETVRADGLIVNFDDARAGRSWTVDDGSLSIDLRGGQTRLRAALALLSGRSYVTTLMLSYDSPEASRAARIALTVQDAAASDIASQSQALAWLAVIDAPLSVAMRLEIDADGALGPFGAALKVGQGALRPETGARPIAFDAAKAYLTYDPVAALIRFNQIEVQSDWGAVRGEGRAYLQELTSGWPEVLIGQLALSQVRLNPPDLYPAPVELGGADVDFRLHLSPFRLDLGRFSVTDTGSAEPSRLDGRGEITASPEGWSVAADLSVDQIGRARLMALWPQSYKPVTRSWFDSNLTQATVFNLQTAFRLAPGTAPRFFLTHEFRDTAVRFMPTMPPLTGAEGYVSHDGRAMTLVVEAGTVTAPQGGAMAMAGTVLHIPDTTIPQPPAEITLAIDSTITAAMSILDQPPFGFITASDLPVTLADGRVRAVGRIALPLAPNLPPGAVVYDFGATLRDVRTTALVPGQVLSAGAIDLRATNAGLRIAGPMRIGTVPVDAAWTQDFAPDARGHSRVEGRIELSERFVDTFNIGLPPGTLNGAGSGQITVDLARGAPPRFALTSDLDRIGLRLPALGWAKPASARGRLEVAGTLGPVPRIERIALDAAGLEAQGSITLNAGGGLDRARFSRVRLGGWLDAPVDLVGRGANRAAQVVIAGGSLDLRRAAFGEGGGQGGPMTIALDRLQISDGIALTGFRGEFDAAEGFAGTFAGNVNGGAAVQGRVVPQGNRSAVRITSDQAGGVLRDAGLLENATGGAMDLTLLPAGGAGSYDGDLRIEGLRVRRAPALASLLSAISVIGLLQQMDGQGLSFDDVRAEFRLTPDQIIVTRSSAVGASLGISADGIYTTATRNMDFQGVVSPLYLINAVGAVLTRRGEGLIGFNFTLRGRVDDMRVGVNPLSVLTPGMFREIFRRPAPVVGQ